MVEALSVRVTEIAGWFADRHRWSVRVMARPPGSPAGQIRRAGDPHQRPLTVFRFGCAQATGASWRPSFWWRSGGRHLMFSSRLLDSRQPRRLRQATCAPSKCHCAESTSPEIGHRHEQGEGCRIVGRQRAAADCGHQPLYDTMDVAAGGATPIRCSPSTGPGTSRRRARPSRCRPGVRSAACDRLSRTDRAGQPGLASRRPR
jgi:hypothetical protein